MGKPGLTTSLIRFWSVSSTFLYVGTVRPFVGPDEPVRLQLFLTGVCVLIYLLLI